MRNQFTRRARVGSYDAATHSMGIIVSSEAEVDGIILRHDPNATDLSYFNSGRAPFLNAHDRTRMESRLGRIEKGSAKFEGRKLTARVLLTKRESAAGLIADVIEGTDVSVGFQVLQWGKETRDPKTGRIVRTALRWKPFEASAVPKGGDENSFARAAKPGSMKMRKVKKPGAANPAPVEDVLDDDVIEPTEEQRAEARAEILRVAGTLPMEQRAAFVMEHADSTIEEAREDAREIIEERTSRTPRARVTDPGRSPQQERQLREDGLFARTMGVAAKPEGREYANMRFVDHARAFLPDRGFGLNDFDAICRAMTTTDLPSLLLGVGNRALEAAYETIRTPLFATGVQRDAPDFRALTNIRASGYGQLEELGGENSEFKNLGISEVEDTFRLTTAGGILPVGFQALTNDDLGGVIPQHATRGATAVAQWQKRKIIALLEDNAVTAEDNENLFSAAHGNIMTPSGIFDNNDSLGPLSDARLALRKMTDLNGVDTLNLRPKFLVVPAEMETEAQRALAAIFAAQSANANPFAESMELLVESDLSQGWYVFASPSAAPVWQHAWLRGQASPQFAQQENFRNLSVELRVHAHWNCGILPGGWRGVIFNPATDESNSGAI